MHYGLTLPNGGTCGDICLLTELGCLAEAAGWDGVFLEDYIVHQGAGPIPTCDPWMALAALAVQTTRVRLGTCVTPLSRRRPWKIAREAVALDHLSHGRFILGVGLGDEQEAGFARVGEILDVRQRAKRLDEALEIVGAALGHGGYINQAPANLLQAGFFVSGQSRKSSHPEVRPYPASSAPRHDTATTPGLRASQAETGGNG